MGARATPKRVTIEPHLSEDELLDTGKFGAIAKKDSLLIMYGECMGVFLMSPLMSAF